jgi:hypothetical protein
VLKHVCAVLEDLAGGRIEGDGHVVAGAVARSLDSSHQHLERCLVGGEVRREAALVAHCRGEPAVVECALERVEDLHAGAQPLRVGGRAHRHDHELLEVDLVVGVRTAVEHVHHRRRQHVRRLAAEIAPQRRARLCGRRLGPRERQAEDRVRAEPRLVGSAVELDHRAVERFLVRGVEAVHRLRELAVHVRDSPRYPLAAPRLAAVAQLDRLELARGGSGRDSRTARRPGLQEHVDLDRRVPAGVEDLATVDLLDAAQSASTSVLKRSAA